MKTDTSGCTSYVVSFSGAVAESTLDLPDSQLFPFWDPFAVLGPLRRGDPVAGGAGSGGGAAASGPFYVFEEPSPGSCWVGS